MLLQIYFLNTIMLKFRYSLNSSISYYQCAATVQLVEICYLMKSL